MPRKKTEKFPLFQHATGQWAKKIKGRLVYFGKDKEKALGKYREEKDQLQAGINPREEKTGPTVPELANQFLDFKRRLVESGELSTRSWNDYHAVCAIFVEFFRKLGVGMIVDLAPEHFEKLRAKLAKSQGPVTLGNSIRRILVVMHWAEENEKIDRPVRMAASFKPPSATTLRKAKQENGREMLEADVIRRIIEAAKQPLRAMILLGLNAALGPSDLAGLPIDAIDLAGGWLNFPRPKTAIPRRCPLWPETVSALQESIEVRPEPNDTADAGLAFITRFGRRWVRNKEREDAPASVIDSVNLEYGKLLGGLGVERHGFYTLRHVHRTVADGSKDQVACDVIMGHVDPSMGSTYRHRVDDSRLLAVVNIVRCWLWHPPLLPPAFVTSQQST